MTRIAQYVADNIDSTIENLLGRFVGATMTLTPEELRLGSTARKVWRNSWPDDFRDALNLIRTYRKQANTKVQWITHTYVNYIPVQVGEDVYSLRVISEDDTMAHFEHPAPVPLERLGLKDPDGFVQWAVRCDEVARRLDTASNALDDLLEMANTPGQLHRMAPDLVRYLPASLKNQLQEQQSKSRLPSQWATYRRSKVRTLCDTLAMCYLLPADYQISAPRHYGHAQSHTWQALPWAVKVDWDTEANKKGHQSAWLPKITRPFEVTPSWAAEVP